MEHDRKGIKIKKTVNFQLLTVAWGRVDSNHRTHPRTDLQSVAIAAMRLPLVFALQRYGYFRYPRHIFVKILKNFVMIYKSMFYR